MCDIVVDAKQVLDYLRNLGYTDIDKDQFKCFLKDLRKLIKHEEQERIENQENIIRSSSSLSYASTVSFQAKKQEPKFRPVVKINFRAPLAAKENLDNNRLHVINTKSSAARENLKPSTVTTSSNAVSEKSLRPKSTNLIKPKRVEVLKKHDPVALYHYYQNIWKKTKIPGEDNHTKLRWEVREKILGDYTLVTVPKSANTAGTKKTLSTTSSNRRF